MVEKKKELTRISPDLGKNYFLFQGKKIYMPAYLRPNADEMIRISHKEDGDCLIVCDGRVGSGKSTIAQVLAAYFDPEFDLSKVCFDADDFANVVIKAKKHSAIIFDESRGGVNIRRTMSAINSKLNSLLDEIRQKNLLIILCLPSIFDMDRSVAIHRATCLIHCFKNKGKKGWFGFYGEKRKNMLFKSAEARRTYSYNVRANFYEHFQSGYAIDEKEYRKLKEKVLDKYNPDKGGEDDTDPAVLVRQREDDIFEKLVKGGISGKKLEQLGIIKEPTVYLRLRKKKQADTNTAIASNTYNSSAVGENDDDKKGD